VAKKMSQIKKNAKPVKNQIQQSSQYARSLIEASLDPLVTINPDGNITDVNEATIKVTGIAREALIGSDFSIYFVEPERAREGYKQVFAMGFVSDYPLTIRHKGGKLTDVLYNASIYKDVDGKVLGVFAAARDVTAQKQSSQYARSLIEASLDPLVTINPDGNITDVNEATIKVTGISREDLIGSDFSIYFVEPEKARAGYKQVFALGFVSDYPLTIRHKGGKLTDVLYNASIYKDVDGKVLGVFAAARDVTAQKQSSQYARSLIEASLDPLVTINPDGNITDVNEATIKVTGIAREALIGSDFSIYFVEPEKAREGYKQVFAMGFVSDYPLTIRHKGGKLTDVLYNASIYKDVDGNVLGVFAAARDVTAQKQAKKQVAEELALSEIMRGEQITSHLGESILSHLVPFTNAQVGAFYLVNDEKKLQIVSVYGLSKGKFLDKVIEFREGLIGQVASDKKSLLIDDVPTSYFGKIESAFGELIPRSLFISPILYENEVIAVIELGSFCPFTEHQRGFLIHVSENIGIAINTSEVRKKVQKQNDALSEAQILLEEKATEVQRASQYKTEFLANMSHELRTPLNSSLILAKLLMENSNENLTPQQIQFASSIYSSGKDLLSLIDDILDLSKVEAGKLDIRNECVITLSVIEGLIQTFQSLAQEKKLILEVNQEASMPQAFQTDRQRLDQILKNLISNALKFTKTGSVKIRLYAPSEAMIAFEVSDTGIGIPKEQQSIIFEAFTQADGTTNRKYGGTGLGLSISKDLSMLLGGRIYLDSTVGKGSRFTLILPNILNEPSVSTSPVSEIKFGMQPVSLNQFNRTLPVLPLPFDDDREELGLEGRTILIIEDDVKFAKILLDLAHELKYKCIIAQGADEGFALALEYTPNGILLDIKLPDHSGLTVLDRLKDSAITRHIPVEVMSVEANANAAIQIGAIGFMLKPPKPEEIKNAFDKLEAKFSQKFYRVLIIEDDEARRNPISDLIADEGIEITTVTLPKEAVIELKKTAFDCMIMVLGVSKISDANPLDQMTREQIVSFPPVIVYTGSTLSRAQVESLKNLSKSIIIKGASSPERLLDEVTLLLHRPESKISEKQREMIRSLRNCEQILDGRKILLVDDDIRNIFALTAALEDRGATIVVGRNGQEGLDKLVQDPQIDLVLMDIMMPEMDGYEATRRIRKRKEFAKLPIIAVTAKAMKDDIKKCIDAGTNDYVSKPVDIEKLMSLIRVWLPRPEF
jgi:PAS domain S-box-containing protein